MTEGVVIVSVLYGKCSVGPILRRYALSTLW